MICLAFLSVDPRAYSPPSAPSFYLAAIEHSDPGQRPRSSAAFLAERKKKARENRKKKQREKKTKKQPKPAPKTPPVID